MLNQTFVWDLSYVDSPVMTRRDTGSDGVLDQSYYFTFDALRNVTSLINASNGNVLERYHYDAYGKVQVYNSTWGALSASAYANIVTFTGRELDSESGLYYFRARYYDPTLGRFLARDPLGYVDGMNLYSGYFVPGGVDPWGLRRAFAVDDEWRLDIDGQGGSHIQKGDLRWDAKTLEPVIHKGITPPALTLGDLEELRRKGILDRIKKNVPGSIVTHVDNELALRTRQLLEKQGYKRLPRAMAREVLDHVIKKVGLPLAILFALQDVSEGGIEQAAKNAILPGDLIEEIVGDAIKEIQENSVKYAKHSKYHLRLNNALKTGYMTQEEAEEHARCTSGYDPRESDE